MQAIASDSDIIPPSAAPPGQLLTLRQARMLPWLPRRRFSQATAESTLYRWATRGSRGERLQIVTVGRTLCTTEKWLLEFFERCNAAQHPVSRGPGAASTTNVASTGSAARELDKAGIT